VRFSHTLVAPTSLPIGALVIARVSTSGTSRRVTVIAEPRMNVRLFWINRPRRFSLFRHVARDQDLRSPSRLTSFGSEADGIGFDTGDLSDRPLSFFYCSFDPQSLVICEITGCSSWFSFGRRDLGHLLEIFISPAFPLLSFSNALLARSIFGRELFFTKFFSSPSPLIRRARRGLISVG